MKTYSIVALKAVEAEFTGTCAKVTDGRFPPATTVTIVTKVPKERGELPGKIGLSAVTHIAGESPVRKEDVPASLLGAIIGNKCRLVNAPSIPVMDDACWRFDHF